MVSRTRPIEPGDAARIARLQSANRGFLAPWDAIRPDVFYTEPGQAVEVDRMLRRREEGTLVAHAILDDDGALVGMIRLGDIVRGDFESCTLGYWVEAAANGHGFASEAVDALLAVAFCELALHRVEAATLRHNTSSQRVLAKNGFEHIGMAPKYIRIAGQWQDHDLFQRLRR